MAKDLEVAIVFADVVGSTQLYDKFGDTKASETVALCLDVMKDATHQFKVVILDPSCRNKTTYSVLPCIRLIE